VPTRGVVYVHSTTSALCPHVEWALAGVLGMRVTLDWTPQPAEPGLWRAELSWQGAPGISSQLASALRGWVQLRYEVTEEPSPGNEGARYSYTPALGLFHAITGVHGDLMVPEDRLRAAMLSADATGTSFEDALGKLLGQPWDDELETFRWAGEGAPVRWLHQVV
jgi:Protein of unknown function (DUF3145)